MSHDEQKPALHVHTQATRSQIEQELSTRFAPEDIVLQRVLARARAEHIPPGHISPLQGKLLQVLMLTCGAQRVLEIGTMTGYSGVWLARALPMHGKLISLEADPLFAAMACQTFVDAGLSQQVEILVGPALDLLPTLLSQAPFDLIFLDADKKNNPAYLDWAIKLSRVGSLIVADNIVRGGRAFQTPAPDESSAGVAQYTHNILTHPTLLSTAIMNDDAINGIDGFSISVVTAKPVE